MLNAIIEFSLRNRFLVLALTAILVGSGVYSAARLPIDAVPDLTNVQVQVLTNAPALGPEEVEQYITFPVEQAMSGIRSRWSSSRGWRSSRARCGSSARTSAAAS